jgi:hypothetical protein
MEKRLNWVKAVLAAAAAGSVFAACGNQAQAPPSTTSVAPTTGKLVFAVGTANIFGATANASGFGTTGLNVAVSYRIGKNSVLNSTPKITGPFKLPSIADSCPAPAAANNPPGCGGVDPFSTGPLAPSVYELAQSTGTIEGTLQTVRPNDPICDAATTCTSINETPNATTFGQSAGVFALGILPSNSTNNGTPYSYQPLPQPFYDSSTGVTIPWGGPPTFDPDGKGDGVRDGYNDNALNTGVQGVSLGIDVFEGVTTPAGAYTMSLQIPNGISSSGSSSYSTVPATANITSTTLLPDLVSPAMVEDGAGGGSFSALAPTITAPFTEVFVQVTDYGPGGAPGAPVGNCQGPLGPGAEAGPVYYTLLYHPGDAATALNLPDMIGPNSKAGQSAFQLSPTLCTAAQNTAVLGAATPADTYSVQLIGTDYPLYEASPLFGANAPTLTGANGQADISMSYPILYTYGTPGGTPQAHTRRSATLRRS